VSVHCRVDVRHDVAGPAGAAYARGMAMLLRRAWAILLGVPMGCAGQPPASGVPDPALPVAPPPPATRAVATTQGAAPGKPFLFDEASLPKGFPPPGAVGEVVVKQYPASRVAVTAGTDQDGMFRPLFQHIKRHEIPMSSPVEITWSDEPAPGDQSRPVTMAFVYRDPGIGSPGADGAVRVVDVPPQAYLSVGERGSYDRSHLTDGLRQLRAWLAAHPGRYAVTGPPRYLGYNSPFVPPFMRFGEVQLPIAAART
jgi:hypothetical protein